MADKVLVCSKDGERLMQERGFRDAVLRTPIGGNPEFKVDDALREQVRRTLGLEHFTVAYFGRVVPEKGVGGSHPFLGELKDLGGVSIGSVLKLREFLHHRFGTSYRRDRHSRGGSYFLMPSTTKCRVS